MCPPCARAHTTPQLCAGVTARWNSVELKRIPAVISNLQFCVLVSISFEWVPVFIYVLNIFIFNIKYFIRIRQRIKQNPSFLLSHILENGIIGSLLFLPGL